LGTTRFRTTTSIDELALSPDEQSVVTLGEELIVWDAATGKQRWSETAAAFGVRLPRACYGKKSIAFAPDGRQFFTPGPRGKILVWDALGGTREELSIDAPREGEIEPTLLNGLEGGYRAIDVARDGVRLALGSASGVVLISGNDGLAEQIGNFPAARLDVNTNDRLRAGGHYSLAQFAPDGKTLAVVTSDTPHVIRIVSADDMHELRRISLIDWLVRMAYSADGARIATTEGDRCVRMYDVQTGKRLWSRPLQLDQPARNYASGVAISPNRKFVAACASDNVVHLLDAVNGTEVAAFEGHSETPWAVTFTKDSQTLYSAGYDGAVRRWSVAERTHMQPPVGKWASSITALSPDGRLLGYQDGWGPVHIYNLHDRSQVSMLPVPGARYGHVRFSPDSKLLAGGGGTGANVLVVVWDAKSGAIVHRWEWPRGAGSTISTTVNALEFNSAGDRLAAAVHRQSIGYLWDVNSGDKIAELNHSQVHAVAFGDKDQLATAGLDGTVWFWDGRTGELRREFNLIHNVPQGEDRRMYALHQVPSAGLLVTAHVPGVVRVWQLDNLALRSEIRLVSRFRYEAVDVSPDGLWIATGASSGEVELWDALSGQRVWDIGHHQAYVRAVSFGRDSRMLLTGGGEGVAYQWDLRRPYLTDDAPVEKLWTDLAGKDSQAAYDAMWKLTGKPEKAVELLAEKLEPVTTLVDVTRVTDGDSEEAKRRQQELLDQLSVNQPEVQSSLVYRRALAVLAQIGTPAARRVLQELTARQPATDDVNRLAREALARAAAQD
jgi:WD40 repeat protein